MNFAGPTLYDTPVLREFVGLDIGVERLPDKSTILRFRHSLDEHDLSAPRFETVGAILQGRGFMLKAGAAVEATIIAAPSCTRNKVGKRDPEMVSSASAQLRRAKKGNPWHFGRIQVQEPTCTCRESAAA